VAFDMQLDVPAGTPPGPLVFAWHLVPEMLPVSTATVDVLAR
jgi:hypothetical protein